jgi:hypothetical protein
MWIIAATLAEMRAAGAIIPNRWKTVIFIRLAPSLATKTRLRAGQSLHFFLTLAFWVAVSLTFLVMTASVAIIPYALDNRGATNT